MTDGAGWITSVSSGASGHALVAAGAGSGLTVNVLSPANCTPNQDTLRVVLQDLRVPGAYDTCRIVITCGFLGVPDDIAELSFDRPQPNPSSGRTTFTYTLPREGQVRLQLFGANGRVVRTLESGARSAGIHAVRWDGRDDSGRRAAPGVYFARLEAGGRMLRQMLTVVR